MCCGCMSDLCLVVLLIFFPPLPVWIRRGVCSADAWINILLCILGYFPGLIHSWYIIAKYPPCSGNHDSKVYYVYQTPNELESQRHSDHHHHHHHSHTYANEPIVQAPLAVAGPSYGSTNQGSSSAPPAYTELSTGK